MAGWMALFDEIADCRACALCRDRTLPVPGEGDPDAKLMLVGEGPGAEEDRLGRPFVGASGQLLTRLLLSVELDRSDVYIANIVKCRPPGNRTPTPEEAKACIGYLRRQFALVRPRIMLLLGGTAAKCILGEDIRIRRDHGKRFERKGIVMIPTFHPSALLRDPSQLRDAWGDFQIAAKLLKEIAED